MEIRILQTQLEEWLPYNPLDAWIYKNIKVFNNNLTAKILCTLNDMGIGIKVHNFPGWNFEGRLPIYQIIPDIYRKVKDKLKNRNLLFLSQVMAGDKYLLTWEQANNIIKYTSRGPTPRWWKEIEKKVLTTESSRLVKSDFRLDNFKEINFNSRLLMYNAIDKRKNNWIVTMKKREQELFTIFGKLINTTFISDVKKFTIEHYDHVILQNTDLKLQSCVG